MKTFGPYLYKTETFAPINANRLPRTSKAAFLDARESFEALAFMFESNPSRELFEGLKYFDALLGAEFHDKFSPILLLSKEEELGYMRETKRRRQCLEPLPSHQAAFNNPADLEHARTLSNCIEEAKTILSSKRKAAANNRWKKAQTDTSNLSSKP